MSIRRTLLTVAVVAGFGASVVVASNSQVTLGSTFGTLPFVSRPYASHLTPITTTWYCPGVPGGGDPTMGGEVVVVNPTDAPLHGTMSLLGSDEAPTISQDIVVPARDKLRFDVDQTMTATFVSAVVELDGGEGMVEQRALYPAGNAVASCTTQTSSTWYFADGSTIDGSVEQLVITNPTSDTATVNLKFSTKSGIREPPAFQGDSIAPHSVRVIAVADSGLVDESIIGVQVEATRGRLIVGRAQHYIGGNRLGYTMNLGAPAPSDQLWWADGEQGAGIVEQYVFFNPTDTDASLTPTVLGVLTGPDFLPPDPFDVPAGKVVTFDMKDVPGLPDGPHTMVFATLAGPLVVGERVLTRPAGDQVATTVVMGMTSEYVVPRWYVPIGVDSAVEDALQIYNLDDTAATVTVKAIGPGGEVAVPSLENLTLQASGLLSVDLTDPSVFGKPLVVEATQRVFVERKLPRGGDLSGRSGSWALPECGPCNFSSPPSS